MDKYSINVKGLTKKFGSFTAVDNISFEVKEGEIFGFLGANGAGKTTAMRILCGLSRPTSGEGTVAGYDIRTQQEEIKKNIGYMSQKFSLYPDLKTRENIELYGGIYGLSDSQIASKTATMLKRLDMEEAANMFVRDMPLGWKQKLAFSIAMIHEPKILFLDEPTGGVDPKTRRNFWDMIYEAAEKGVTIFVTTHYMDEAVKADRVIVMDGGRIAMDGTPKEVFRNVERMKKLGLDVPQATELAYRLRKKGFKLPEDILDENECAEAILKVLEVRK